MSRDIAQHHQWEYFPYTIPNVFSLVRLLCAPLVIVAAFLGASNAFLVVFAMGMFTDFADGMAARLLNQRSPLGVKLDGLGDIAVYTATAIGGWMLWPEKLLDQSSMIIIVIAGLVLSGSISWIKHHQLPLYHTWITKCASAALGITTFMLFIGYMEIAFKFALILMILSSLEEICVTLIIPVPMKDIRSIQDALRKRRSVLSEE